MALISPHLTIPNELQWKARRGIKQLMIELVVSMDSGRIVQWPNSEGMQLPADLKSDAEIDVNGSEND